MARPSLTSSQIPGRSEEIGMEGLAEPEGAWQILSSVWPRISARSAFIGNST